VKLVTFVKPGEKVQPPLWADLVLRLYINNVRGALLSVYGYPDDVLLLRNDVKITDKDAVVKFFRSFKTSASIKYGNQEIGYFLSTRDKNMNSRLVVTHYALKV
jgi:RNA recognition motif-containing protein